MYINTKNTTELESPHMRLCWPLQYKELVKQPKIHHVVKCIRKICHHVTSTYSRKEHFYPVTVNSDLQSWPLTLTLNTVMWTSTLNIYVKRRLVHKLLHRHTPDQLLKINKTELMYNINNTKTEMRETNCLQSFNIALYRVDQKSKPLVFLKLCSNVC